MKAFALGLAAASVPFAAGPGTVAAEHAEPSRHAAEWRPVDAATGQIRDAAELEALAVSFPDSGSVRLRLLNAQLGGGDGVAALATLRWLKERGYVFSDVARQQIPRLIGEEWAQAAESLLLPPAAPIERSSVAWTLPAHAGLVESVLVDEARERALATSVTGRAIWEWVPGSEWRGVAIEGADNLSGIAFDSAAGAVWVASGNIDASEDSEPLFSGLVGLRSGGDRQRIAAPADAVLSDIHVGPNGTIYASDPLNGGVYRVGPDRAEMEILVPPGALRSPQGLAVSRAGDLLYVSDYRYGIAIVDLRSGALSRLVSDVPILLDGTDALFRRDDSLIAIQNGTSPMRIARIELSRDGRRVVGHAVLEQAHSEWSEPLSGFLGAGGLYYVGNGQWDRWVKGEPALDKPSVPTQIRRLPLDP